MVDGNDDNFNHDDVDDNGNNFNVHFIRWKTHHHGHHIVSWEIIIYQSLKLSSTYQSWCDVYVCLLKKMVKEN